MSSLSSQRHNHARYQSGKSVLSTLVVSIVLLSFGVAGVLTAYSGIPSVRAEFVASQLEETPVPLDATKPAENSPSPKPLTEDSDEKPQPESSDSSDEEMDQTPENDEAPSALGQAILDRFRRRIDDWYGAGVDPEDKADDKKIDRLHVRFIDDSKTFQGQFSQLGTGPVPLRFTIVGNNGIVKTIEVEPDGSFIITGLEPGVYGVFIEGHRTVMAFAVYVGHTNLLRAEGYTEDEIKMILARQVRGRFNLRPKTTPTRDYEKVMELIAQAEDRSMREHDQLESVELDIPETVDFSTAEEGTSVKEHDVKLSHDGHLRGRIRHFVDGHRRKLLIVPSNNVELNFIQNNEVVATGVTELDGTFDIEGVLPGTYSLVMVGRQGYAALGVIVGEPFDPENPGEPPAEGNQDQSPEAIQEVSFRMQEGSGGGSDLSLDVALTPPNIPPPAPAGGGGGGGGGGGAAGGGGFIPIIPIYIPPDDNPSSPDT